MKSLLFFAFTAGFAARAMLPMTDQDKLIGLLLMVISLAVLLAYKENVEMLEKFERFTRGENGKP